MKKPKIVVVGSSNTDMIIQLDRLPQPGETIIGGEFSIAAGGKGANQAVSAARAGGAVNFLACLGNDMFGNEAIEGFKKDGISVRHLVKDASAPSGVAFIFVDKKGENSIAVASGANARLTPEHVRQAGEVITSADLLMMQLETPLDTIAAAARLAAASKVRVILNPAPARELSDELLRNISILTPNETEAELLTGIKIEDEPGAKKSADVLLRKGLKTVIITLGARGAVLAEAGRRELIPGFKVRAVDSTAAGDVFNGALAVALGEGRSSVDSVRFANAAAALSVTKLGAQPSAPYRQEIEELLLAGLT